MDDLTEHLVAKGKPDRTAVILGLKDAADRQCQAEVDQVALVAAAAEAYSWIDEPLDDNPGSDSVPSVLHGERLIVLGGDGTPEVAEFCSLEVGPALGISPDAAAQLIADVLDLRHRHPQLWALVIGGYVRVFAARKVAQLTRTRELTHDMAGEVDRKLAPFAPQYTVTRLLNQAELLCDVVDPDGAEARRKAALERRFVTVRPGEAGTALVTGQVDGPAALRLDKTITQLAGILRDAGHRDSADGDGTVAGGADVDPLDPQFAVLRAQALELLADPARAGRVLGTGSLDLDDTDDPDTSSGLPSRKDLLELVVHVRLDEVDRGAGGQVTGLGSVARSQLDAMLANAERVTVRPVLDPQTPHVTVGYEPTVAQRREVLLQEEYEAFPFSTRRSAGKFIDLDHITPFPVGQTCTTNLSPLSKRVHRAKTFGGFTSTPVRPGVKHWKTPTGQEFWTTPHGTYTRNPDTDLIIDPTGTRRRIRQATRRAAELAEKHTKQQICEEARTAAERLFAQMNPALIPLTEETAA
ncbi:DUF222 domain-containing protein [Mariniluteicoccus flavus]